ncbi:FAD-dependent oxidoreductase [Dactylosporangium darangshiense]|uniref:FAD-dependent oxidoreductase n=1 Tax=Dactylosporangium darangshiense TaxID=579108 RepID=UPI0031EA15BD
MELSKRLSSRIVVVGGGYGGITAAKALDDVADVTLVEPRETFVHNVAALRAAVRPEWVPRLFIRYDGLLARGRVVRDRAASVRPGAVELESGEVLPADYIVLATGTTYPFPAKIDTTDAAAAADRLHRLRGELERASGVLLLGAGPVGLEFAGEIAAEWPGKPVTVVDPHADLVSGRFPGEFRARLREQLAGLGVRLLLGTSLAEPPATAPGLVAPFTVRTRSGDVVAADLWFACHGAATGTGYLGAELAGARRADGRLEVTEHLRVAGQETVFAVGDVTGVPEMKTGRLAQQHAEVAAANIRRLIEGDSQLQVYAPQPDAIVLPLGPAGGMSYAPEAGVLGPQETAQIKATFFIEGYLDLLGAADAAMLPSGS